MHSAIAHSIVSVVELILPEKASYFQNKKNINVLLFKPIHKMNLKL